MITALDSNVLVSLWDADNALNMEAQRRLDEAHNFGELVISAPVFAELVGFPAREADFVDRFLDDSGIVVEWNLDEAIWRFAAEAFRNYARRRKGREGVRRILTDFVIGAHAQERGYRLLTFDKSLYATAFPRLELVKV
jgi:predicted nucleic acid-binding protein